MAGVDDGVRIGAARIGAGRIGVVGAAIVRDGRLLTCRRTEPPTLAGQWEFPGGKIEAGETPRAALIRECQEELGVTVEVGERLGEDILLGDRYLFQVFWCTIDSGAEIRLHDHDQLAWLGADEVFDVPWIEVDLDLVAAARARLR
jgi:8-oxo-dGTP diphosphatase